MQKREDVPISLSSWAVSDYELGAEELYRWWVSAEW